MIASAHQNPQRPNLPLLGFAAYSGTGKTTLLEALLPKLTATGLRIGLLKHAHHDFDVDKPGKDSYRLRKAGASQMLIASRNRHALITETPDAEAEFDYLLTRFDAEKLDVILVEGCKNIAFPKIELHRAEVGKPWLYPHDKNIIAIAADETVATDLPQMHINDLDAIADFVLDYVNKWRAQQIQPHTVSDSKNNAAACCDTLSPAFLSVEQGREKILSLISPLAETESVAIQECYQRVLAREVFSPNNVPAYRNSAMDGYALRSDDLERDSYRVVAEVLAGSHYPKTVERGEAVKIMTGAPMPLGADTVVMREQATQNGELVSFAGAKIKAGQNVRQAGEDLAQGQAVFSIGQRVLSPEMGMLASLGFAHADAFRSLKVAIFSTGDEVQAPGGDIEPNSIFDSNRFTLTGLLKQLGCQVIDLGIIEDDEAKMMQVLEQAAKQADVVITSGGV
ncbi:bifunctional molybdopterin-guanine dinucleotide biosynthesis adaptor protein MobB/molybdopterin molybdotransferase MoeA, partial [Vibrio cholerae]